MPLQLPFMNISTCPLATAQLHSTTIITRFPFQDLLPDFVAASRTNSGCQPLLTRLPPMTSWTLVDPTSLSFTPPIIRTNTIYPDTAAHSHCSTLTLTPRRSLSPIRLLGSISTSLLPSIIYYEILKTIIHIIAALIWPGWDLTTGFGYSIYLPSSPWTLED